MRSSSSSHIGRRYLTRRPSSLQSHSDGRPGSALYNCIIYVIYERTTKTLGKAKGWGFVSFLAEGTNVYILQQQHSRIAGRQGDIKGRHAKQSTIRYIAKTTRCSTCRDRQSSLEAANRVGLCCKLFFFVVFKIMGESSFV